MAKMADALREKARQEQQAYQDRRNQATEWGPVAHVAGDEASRYLEWAKDRSAWEMPVGTPVYYSALASAPVAGEAQPAVAWENFPAYLIDHCEGDTISEEGIQRALSRMLADPKYAAPQTGPVSGEAVDLLKKAAEALAGYRREMSLLQAWDEQPCDAEKEILAALSAPQAISVPGEAIEFFHGQARNLKEILATRQIGRRVINEHLGVAGATEVSVWKTKIGLLLEVHSSNGGQMVRIIPAGAMTATLEGTVFYGDVT